MTGYISPVRKFLHGFLVCLACAAAALGLWALGWLDTWEAKTWDWRVKLMAEPGEATDNILLILLDQNSLDWAKDENGLSWPWPREVYGTIIDYCRRNGAKSLGFDVMFTEPSGYGMEDDLALSRSISKFGHFALPVFPGNMSGSVTKWPDNCPSPKFHINNPTDSPAIKIMENMIFPRAVMPIPELAQNSSVLCNTRQDPDPDGIYRRFKLLSMFDNRLLPALGLGVYLSSSPEAKIEIEHDRLKVGDSSVPIDRQGNVVLRFRGPSCTYKSYSAAAVIQSEIRLNLGEKPVISDGNVFKDKYVFFGFSAPGLFDLRPSPVDGTYPGVEIYATMLDNFLSGDFMRKAPEWMTVAILIFMVIACVMCVSFFSSSTGIIVISLIFFSSPVLFSLVSYNRGIWLPLIVQETAFALTLASALMLKYVTEGRKKRYINNAFRHYLSPAVIEQLKRHPEKLMLGGERRMLSIFFSDLRGFTSISERLSPEELTLFLNEYLSAMTDIILDEEGTVDKYEGDSVMAFWNAPLNVPDHAERAVRAALRCHSKLAEMRPCFRERFGNDIFMRIGINTGAAVAGNMGSRSRFNYTIIGDAVNLASRLEGANKQFGTGTIISRWTRDLLGDGFEAREIARLAVVGRKEPVKVYEPVTKEEYEERKSIFETFSMGLDMFYRGNFKEALKYFESIDKLDKPAAAYAEKCKTLKDCTQGDWKGVWVMNEK